MNKLEKAVRTLLRIDRKGKPRMEEVKTPQREGREA